ncbi:MAG TPA: glycosyltransferase family 4 protein [Gemmatimonadales bacterium]|nr:glycosyltransferase family 4 protein [Gemmatimonadales bacterium]
MGLGGPAPRSGKAIVIAGAALEGLSIAHLIESDGPGGAERMVASLAAGLQARGASNLVIGPANGEGWLARELEGSGVRVEAVDLSRPFRPRFAKEVAAILRRHRARVAHSHEFTMAVCGAWAARRAGAAHLFTMHGSRYYAERLRRRMALRAAAALSGAVVAVSRTLAEQLRRDLWTRPATIPNGARAQAVTGASLRRELGLEGGDRLALAVGNLYLVKGHRYLLEALATLDGRAPRLHVAIAGRGELEEALRARAAALGIAERTHFLGLRSDIGDLLSDADLFVMPSLSEGLPLAAVEAMLAGKPIVASAVGELPAVLDDGRAGLVVPPGDARALAEGIGALLADPDRARRLGGAARERACAEYTVERMVERYARLYGALV